MDALNARKNALHWWNGLNDERKAYLAHTHLNRRASSLTGREVEEVYNSCDIMFRDFPIDELVGKKVLYTYGLAYAGKSRRIAKIVRVFKKSFHIEGDDGKFSIIDGHEAGIGVGNVSKCQLISEAKAASLMKEFGENKRKCALIEDIENAIQNKDRFTVEQLQNACVALGLNLQ